MARDPRLQQLLAAQGITAITPEVGADLHARAAGAGRPVLLGAPMSAAIPTPFTALHLDGAAVEASLALDPAAPRLADHQVAGAAIVPAAVWIEAAVALVTGLGPVDQLHLGVVEVVEVTRVSAPAVATLRLGGDAVHISVDGTLRARLSLASAPQPAAALSPGMVELVSAEALYGALLFHGPHWQVLGAVGTSASGCLSAELRPRGSDPIGIAEAVDGMFQLLAVWCAEHTGWLALPVGLDAATVHLGAWVGPLSLTGRAQPTDSGARADLVLRDGVGDVVLAVHGATLRRARRSAAAARSLHG